jgi:hypothetical protein
MPKRIFIGSVSARAQRLVELGIPALMNLSADEFSELARRLPDEPDAILAVHPNRIPARAIAPLLCLAGKPGFVVADMTDLDAFVPIEAATPPDAPLYQLAGIDRGDDLRNWSPDEALPELARRDRRPLTIHEAIYWLLQDPDRLEPNYCFMAIGSRKPNGKRLDARTPAVWISGGTGRDGAESRGAPKVGWCWAGNRHTWLGFASCRV